MLGRYLCLYEMKLLILFYSSNCTPGRPRQIQIKGWRFPKAAVWKDYPQLIPYTGLGFSARGKPDGGGMEASTKASWGKEDTALDALSFLPLLLHHILLLHCLMSTMWGCAWGYFSIHKCMIFSPEENSANHISYRLHKTRVQHAYRIYSQHVWVGKDFKGHICLIRIPLPTFFKNHQLKERNCHLCLDFVLPLVQFAHLQKGNNMNFLKRKWLE